MLPDWQESAVAADGVRYRRRIGSLSLMVSAETGQPASAWSVVADCGTVIAAGSQTTPARARVAAARAARVHNFNASGQT